MTVNNDQQGNEIDWSRVNARTRSKERVAPDLEQEPTSIARAEDSSPLQFTPGEITIPEPEMNDARGFLVQFQKKQIDRKAALTAIQERYDAQIDALRFHLRKAVSVSNARSDRIAEEFLKKLDSEHLQILKDFGLRNAETRATALIEIRDMIAAKLMEVQAKKWPPALVERTIDDLLDLEKRVCTEMMKELGA